MPLDTAPLSTKRRLIAFGVLLAFLGGSLALAQLIVSNHKGGVHWTQNTRTTRVAQPVRYIVEVPESFTAGPRDQLGNVIMWTHSGPAGNRMILRSDYSKAEDDDDETLADRMEDMSNLPGLTTSLLKSVSFGGRSANLFIGTDSKGKIRAYMVLAGVSDHYISLIYSGDKESTVTPTSPLTEADEAAVMEICRKSRVVVGVAQSTPQTVLHTAPQTSPQSGPTTTPR